MRVPRIAPVFMLLLLASTAAAQARGRVVGVYDQANGDPIEGARVRDMATGTFALTTKTGTVSLSFVDTAGTIIDVRKLGFEPIMRAVSNSSSDTMPLMILMRRVVELPTVISTARRTSALRGPADTVRRLELSGFYDRRVTSGAPMSAFVTDSMVKRLSTLNDLRFLTGRDICNNNLYLDGVMVRAGDNLFKLITPDMIAGVEMYTHAGELPSQYNPTKPQGTPIPCATVIWTK